MIAIGLLFVRMLCDYFKLRQQLEAEILALRHQLRRGPVPDPHCSHTSLECNAKMLGRCRE
jgi:hypothetical protein